MTLFFPYRPIGGRVIPLEDGVSVPPASEAAWDQFSTEHCVSCPDCAFTFDSAHTDQDGGYSCPCCAEAALVARLAEAERVRGAAQDFIDTMNLRHSDVESREVPSGFSIESNPAAIRLFDALAALPPESAEG